jgi:hypothetical protein
VALPLQTVRERDHPWYNDHKSPPLTDKAARLSAVASERRRKIASGAASAKLICGNIAIAPALISMDHYDEAAQRLYLTHDGVTNWLSVDGDLLARIMSWIDNGGTGLFTQRGFGSQQAQAMGMSAYGDDQWVASEFAGSRFAEVLHYLDFPDIHLVTNSPMERVIMRKHNGMDLSLQWITNHRHSLVDGDYVVSDLDSDFIANVAGGRIGVSGNIYGYLRLVNLESKKVIVYGVFQFDTAGFKSTTASPEKVDLHKQAISLVRTAAILRALHDGNPASWEKFESGFFTGQVVK